MIWNIRYSVFYTVIYSLRILLRIRYFYHFLSFQLAQPYLIFLFFPHLGHLLHTTWRTTLWLNWSLHIIYLDQGRTTLFFSLEVLYYSYVYSENLIMPSYFSTTKIWTHVNISCTYIVLLSVIKKTISYFSNLYK